MGEKIQAGRVRMHSAQMEEVDAIPAEGHIVQCFGIDW
jgi:hypothetical protein